MTLSSTKHATEAELLAQRQRFKLSLLLSNIQSGVDKIIGQKTAEEKEALTDTALALAGEGARSYAKLIRARIDDPDDSPIDRFLLSAHGTSIVDALRLALNDNDTFTQQQKVEFFAALAQVLLDGVIHEAKWTSEHNWVVEVDPEYLLDISVLSTEAMDALHQAGALRQLQSDPVAAEHIALKVAEEISRKAKQNAALAHVEHKAYKADVFEWCDKNLANYKSLNKAAEAVAGKLVPVVFTTAQSWVREYAKNNPGFRQKPNLSDAAN